MKGKEHLVLLFSERFEEPLITIRLSTTVVQMERSAQVYPILRSSYVNLIFHNVLINFPRRFSHRSPQELQLDIARLTELRYEENISRKGKNNHSPQFLKTWSMHRGTFRGVQLWLKRSVAVHRMFVEALLPGARKRSSAGQQKRCYVKIRYAVFRSSSCNFYGARDIGANGEHGESGSVRERVRERGR